MGTLLEDIKAQSAWLVKAFDEDYMYLDYSIHSLIDIDRFFNKHSKNGRPKRFGRLSANVGPILFSIAAYVGNCFIENIKGAKWITDDTDPEGELHIYIRLPDGSEVYPLDKVTKRLKNGTEDSIYVYGFWVAEQYIDEKFDERYWRFAGRTKPWWKFW